MRIVSLSFILGEVEPAFPRVRTSQAVSLLPTNQFLLKARCPCTRQVMCARLAVVPSVRRLSRVYMYMYMHMCMCLYNMYMYMSYL